MWTAASLTHAARLRPDAVAHLGLRTTSPTVQHALSLAATNGTLTATELAGALTDPSGTTRDVLNAVSIRTDVVAALALMWCGGGHPSLLAAGSSIYEWLAARGALPALAPVHEQAAAQSLFLAGKFDAADRVLPTLARLPVDVRHYLRVDLSHPDTTTAADYERWEALLSAPFLEHELSPIRVASPESNAGHNSPHTFDRLAPTVAAGTAGGPGVSVVVPCYRPDVGLVTSVASIIAQTYADLDIVIVDDASGSDYAELIQQAAALDPRVRVVHLEHNGGSYVARTAGIAESSSSLITTQDADDWSHPERIEAQVAHLRAHPGASASRSRAIRARDDLTHQWFGYGAVRTNASSLLMKREVWAACGGFLPVRKAGDSEYAERLELLAGPIIDTPAPLAVTRLREGSLSRADFSYQHTHPDRLAFRGAYRSMHRRLAASTDREPGFTPAVEAPRGFARGIDSARMTPTAVDVVVLADFSQPPRTDPNRTAALRALVADFEGMQIGLWHVERPLARTVSRPEMTPDWFDLVADEPQVHVVTRVSDLATTSLVVVDPTALLTATGQPTSITTERVEVVITPHDLGWDAQLPLDILGVADDCLLWWGMRPRWLTKPDASAPDVELVRRSLPGLKVDAWPYRKDHP